MTLENHFCIRKKMKTVIVNEKNLEQINGEKVFNQPNDFYFATISIHDDSVIQWSLEVIW